MLFKIKELLQRTHAQVHVTDDVQVPIIQTGPADSEKIPRAE